MFLKPSDFTGEYTIPNLGDTLVESNKLGNNKLIQGIYNKELKKELIRLLGFNLYKELEGVIDLDEANRLKPSADEKWDFLLNGKDDYFGLIHAFIPLVYFHYLRITNSELTGLGVSKQKSKGADIFSSKSKAVDSYRAYIENVYGGVNYRNIIEFEGVFSVTYASGENELKSVYDFLNDNTDLFTTWNEPSVKLINNINRHGL